MSSSATASVRRLLESPFDSFEKLEVGIALFEAPAHTSSIPELASKLGLTRELVERAVLELARTGIVHVAGGLTRLTVSGADAPAFAELARLYEEDRLLVVRIMSEVAMDRIRGMAARTFADAFQLRKKKDDDDG